MIEPVTLSVCSTCAKRNSRIYSRNGEPVAGGLCESCCTKVKVRLPIQLNVGWFSAEDAVKKIKTIKNRKVKAKNLLALLIAAKANNHKLTSCFNGILEISRNCVFVDAGSKSDAELYVALRDQTAILSELCQYHGVALITASKTASQRDTLQMSRPKQLRPFFAPGKTNANLN